MLTVAVPKRNKLQNIIVLTPKDGFCFSASETRAVTFYQIVICAVIHIQWGLCHLIDGVFTERYDIVVDFLCQFFTAFQCCKFQWSNWKGFFQ